MAHYLKMVKLNSRNIKTTRSEDKISISLNHTSNDQGFYKSNKKFCCFSCDYLTSYFKNINLPIHYPISFPIYGSISLPPFSMSMPIGTPISYFTNYSVDHSTAHYFDNYAGNNSDISDSDSNNILRFRTKVGMLRVEAKEDQHLLSVLEQLSPKLPKNVDFSSLELSEKPTSDEISISSLSEKTCSQLGLKHGSLLYLSYSTTDDQSTLSSTSPAMKSSLPNNNISGPKPVEQLPIDDKYDKVDGYIKRKRSTFCRHSDKGMCEYCSPLPPWDKQYREEHAIKHMSFQSFIKQSNESTNKKSSSASYISPINESSFIVDKNCRNGHLPWPKGICSKCQPSAITLQQQEFRLVDHLEFAHSQIVNNFIESWRITGKQRFGYLYGTYEEYEEVPLGVKGVVQVIYEPTQQNEDDGLIVDINWENETKIDSLAKKFGLQKIGMIFTDLTDAGNNDGTVFCKRNKDTFFLSSLEVILAATLQNKNKNPCKWSDSGRFSSKFVTCVISGNEKGDIDISSYQVSQDAEALVEADIICGSSHPSMAYINDTNSERYVPEIFYRMRNEYNILVKKNAKPAFPVDFLLVTLSHGFPQAPKPLFKCEKIFPIENRSSMGASQDISSVKRHLGIKGFENSEEYIKYLSDFHLLGYLFTLGVLNEEEKDLIVKVIVKDDMLDIYTLLDKPGWKTLITLLNEI
ncbi:nuclear protein localization protein 4 [Ascoidea rubescens DSM 1968]|uniref:Nuclear protein localization protein 4 n=1 Tax=Ascoidea rubescens DSM 1968 TaxID=1344418 RepID=A0A1D2VSH8_9ASCO|nr:polyubiquitin-tagged protein recognition complex, Npl4 component [Ascoidea rubescens DSM 1968]ODV64549.1 polyubiquitin-tagged protein recognition complex, Npl4 component [Ascoidea rubescens DSM 1968]